MSGKLDVKRIAAAAGGRSSAMPDKHISLDLQLPHGKTITLQFRRDLTVDYVKLQLAGRCGVQVSALELELDGKAMADPLSLSDFPSLAASGRGVVRVVLEGGADGATEEEKEQAEEEAERDARDLESLNDEDLADDFQHGARIR